MKVLLRFAAVFLTASITLNASAQIPDYGVWPSGVKFTDIDGAVHDIDSILDAGNPVIIDAFADWCAPCWSYHQGHALEDLFTQYGPSGTDELAVFGIESDPNEPESNISNTNTGQGDWTVGVTYPQANDDDIAGIINLAYYPTVIMVCPNREVTEVGQKSTNALYSYTQGCEGLATNSIDPKLIANESSEYFCTGEEANIEVVMQNYGNTDLTSATIEVFNGANSLITENWTGNLSPYETTNVFLGTVSPTSTTDYTIKITSQNDDVSNDEISATVLPATVLEVGSTNQDVTFTLDVDSYTSEIGFIFDEGTLPNNSYVGIHNDAADNIITPIGFSQVGSYSDNESPITENWSVNNEGCHYAVFVDAYGDGYVYQTPNASISISGAGGSSISVDPDFGIGTHSIFEVQFIDDLGVNTEEFASSFKAYPNPASSIVTVDFELQNQNEVTVEILNTVGQSVAVNNLGKVVGLQTATLDVSSLTAGMYIVKVKTNNGEYTKRISVAK